ncbi:SpoIIE family protein phosphatase [Candidatus Entotheonella palauensis]|nr:SpoIIE family protein phosphatase [Candidatus Entotheonella palauensis]
MAVRALNDDPHCGDVCRYWRQGHTMTLCIADGLGHGLYAERAAQAAVDYVGRHLTAPLEDIFAGCDQALHRTRGVAMGLAIVDEAAEALSYAGIGNPRAIVVGKRIFRLRNDYGVVGSGYRALSTETVSFRPGDLVILATDGVAETVDVSAYSLAERSNVQDLANRILRDWRRETDDAAVLVGRREGGHRGSVV